MAADFPAVSDMDAFLINPTVKMSREYVRRSADDFLPLEFNEHLLRREASKAGDDFSSKGFILELSQKAALPREYTSEEEETTTSPSDNEYSAFGSTSSEGDADSDTFSFEELELIDDDGSVPQGLPLCSKAQSVYIISAGRAKVVSVSSSTASSSVESSPRFVAGALESSFALFGSSKTHQRSQQAASNYARTRSPEPRAQPGPSPSRSNTSQSLPRLNATPDSGPTLSKQSQTPLASQRAELGGVKQDQLPSNWPLPPTPISPASPAIPPRRMPRLFNSNSMKHPRRKISNASDRSTGSLEAVYPWAAVPPRSNLSMPSQPLILDATSQSMTYYEPPRKQKLIPRGAGERAPTLMLPPAPRQAQAPLRVTTGAPLQQDVGTFQDFRRKSAVATAQF